MSVGVEDSWAHQSLLVLNQWSIEDWPQWHGAATSSIAGYKAYVDGILGHAFSARWSEAARCHRSDIPYLQFETSPGLGVLRWRHVGLGARVQLGFRS